MFLYRTHNPWTHYRSMRRLALKNRVKKKMQEVLSKMFWGLVAVVSFFAVLTFMALATPRDSAYNYVLDAIYSVLVMVLH